MLKVKSVHLIHQLPLRVVGLFVSMKHQEVESLELSDHGVLMKETKRFGGKTALIPFTNITSIEVEHEAPKSERQENVESAERGAGEKSSAKDGSSEPDGLSKASRRGRPRKQQ